MMILETKVTGGSLNQASSRFILSAIFLLFQSLLLQGCSLFTPRPVQDMSQTSAALRAAKEVQADVLAPELFRQAAEIFAKAKREYKFKNFNFATIYAQKARRLAEEAEFEALRNGGNRSSEQVSDPLASSSVGAANNFSGGNGAAPSSEISQEPAPEANPSLPGPAPASLKDPIPQGTPVEVYEQRKAAEDEVRKKLNSNSNEGPSGITPTPAALPTLPVPLPS